MSPGRRGCWHSPAAPRRSSRSRRWPRWLRCRLMPRYSGSRGGPLKRSALTSLRAILRSAATALGVERAAHEALIAEMWSEIAGQEAAAHAHPAELRGTTLLVEVEQGLWVQELSARRGQFVEAINRRLGGHVVAEIRIRPGRGAVVEPGPDGAAPVEGGDPKLSEQELSTIDRTVAEIPDQELREAARRAMHSEMMWRKRRAASRQSAVDSHQSPERQE